MTISIVNIGAFLILLVIFAINIAFSRRRRRVPQRPIRAFDEIQPMVGRSIEAGEPLHVSLGAAGIGDSTTLLALVGKEFIYYLTREVTLGDVPPLFTVAESSSLPLAMDTLRRAYTDEGKLAKYRALSSRWYPSGTRSLAFAAALMSIQADDKVSGNILVGRYGTELALVLDAAYQQRRASLAVSDRLDGQAIAYALGDGALIGEEIFGATAYVSDETHWTNRNLVLDLSRLLLIAAIIGWFIVNAVNAINGGQV